MATKKSGLSAAEIDWQTEDDLRTLVRAREIEKDPKRMKAAQELAKKKMVEVAAVASDTDD
jgi:hypothetical protein